MKNIIGGIALGFLLAGCGGPEVDEGMNSAAPALAETEQNLCEGWQDPYANRCTAKCGTTWVTAGYYPGTDYGQCGAVADAHCRYHYGVGASGACWSR
ncbi:hypothetical protein SAMN05444354_12324 [Stigmatella aurantiaca]|uniref:Lipoprotein n=1 Tax=Stigmatella aurantiaca TaxID=41 RepID=A0A1H8BA61_STIAU|nr:hypothetical protein [Stigmatella aurantiaca]SEM78747.1 hypothetical protein SAMN05444354_12324 [Stigmatella aurantiaca]